MTCLSAFTPISPIDGNYVAYVNATELDDSKVRLIVRSQGESGAYPQTGEIVMTQDEWADFISEAVCSGSPSLIAAVYEAIGEKARQALRVVESGQ